MDGQKEGCLDELWSVCWGFGELGLGIINGKKKGNEKDIKKTSKRCDKPPESHFFFPPSWCVCLVESALAVSFESGIASMHVKTNSQCLCSTMQANFV